MATLSQMVQRLSIRALLPSQKYALNVAVQNVLKVGRLGKNHASLCQIHTSAIRLRQMDNRKYPASRLPSSRSGRWEPRKKMSELYEYTTEPLPFPKTGGRGPNGRLWTHRIGGGRKREFRMIDWIRGGPSEGEPLVEKVHRILEDPIRSARIALVASDEHKRYIIATQNMKPGDLIKSSTKMTTTTVRASEGDAYPLGSLPVGTVVNTVQRYESNNARVATAAGVSAQIVRKMGDRVVVRLPSKHELAVPATCQATVGRVSNIEHNQRVIGKAGANRWLGIRPKSGRWHRKTGRFGRKIKPLPPVKVAKSAPPQKSVVKRFTF